MRTMEAAAKAALAPLFEHMAAGLRDAHGFNAEKALPDAWEARMRSLLLEPQAVAALMALQLPLEGVTRQLAEQLAALMAAGPKEEGGGAGGREEPATPSRRYRCRCRAGPSARADDLGLMTCSPCTRSPCTALHLHLQPSPAPAAAPPRPAHRPSPHPARPRYFSVSSRAWLAPVMDAVRPLLPPEAAAQLKRDELHVTLWHRDDPELGPDEALREQLAGAEGAAVRLRLLALYHSPEVTAAEVELLGGPDAACARDFHHITLRTAPGVAAKSSNQLPGRLAAGDAGVVKLALPPVVLEGVITAV